MDEYMNSTSDFFKILSMPISRYVIIPIAIVIISNWIKYIFPNDKYARFSREAFYWGPDLITSALLTSLVDFSGSLYLGNSQLQNDTHSNILFTIITFFIITCIMSFCIRKFGWSDETNGMKQNLIGGIIIPDFLGIALLYIDFLILR